MRFTNLQIILKDGIEQQLIKSFQNAFKIMMIVSALHKFIV